MPPKQSSRGRGRPKANTTTTSRSSKTQEPQSSNPFESSDDGAGVASPDFASGLARDIEVLEDAPEEEEAEKTIPRDLLTRILHEFFAKEATRISKDANSAAGKYMDVFVREAIARAAVEKDSGFMEVSCTYEERSAIPLLHAMADRLCSRLRTWRRYHPSCCWISEQDWKHEES